LTLRCSVPEADVGRHMQQFERLLFLIVGNHYEALRSPLWKDVDFPIGAGVCRNNPQCAAIAQGI